MDAVLQKDINNPQISTPSIFETGLGRCSNIVIFYLSILFPCHEQPYTYNPNMAWTTRSIDNEVVDPGKYLVPSDFLIRISCLDWE